MRWSSLFVVALSVALVGGCVGCSRVLAMCVPVDAHACLETERPLQGLAEGKKKGSIEVLDVHYDHAQQALRAVADGMIESNGECTPNVKVGLLHLNAEGQWDTLVYPGSAAMIPCGPPMHLWEKDTVLIKLPATYHPVWTDQVHYEGTFKFLFRTTVKGTMVYQSSNAFVITPTISNDARNHPIRGFLDTTVVSSYQFNQLHFYHMRAFTGEFGGHYRVWHRIRVSYPFSKTPYVFDQAFSYLMRPADPTTVCFATDDYNLDGCEDFRVCNFEGGYDYYLFDPDQGTFVYSGIFSTAKDFAVDSETNTLIASYERFVPLEGMYHHEAIFALRGMQLLELYQLFPRLGGWVKEPVDLREFYLVPRLTGWAMPHPEMQNIYDPQTDAITNKRHYDKDDRISIICRAQDGLDTSLPMQVVLDQWDARTQQWTAVSSKEVVYDQSTMSTDTGFKFAVDCFPNISPPSHSGSKCWTPGTYSISMWQKEKLQAQTPSFFVFD
jgi:hypothetical protein